MAAMTSSVVSALTQGAMITAFVAVMMIAVEYVSVLSRGSLQQALEGSRWVQYLAAVLLGATPGCLGAFTVVALYSHRLLPLGAVVGAMIATSGDEAFVMLALFPATAVWLTLALAAVGLAVAPLVDLLAPEPRWPEACDRLVVHVDESCRCFPGREVLAQWRHPRLSRVVLTAASLLFLAGVVTAGLGARGWSWIEVTLLLVGLFGAFVVATVPDHFLEEHLWRHVTVRHVPRILGWTVGVLFLVALADHYFGLPALVRENRWTVLVAAALIGIVPESGPHLVFVSLFAEGALPLSILVTSSIIQDGHGMLPLLAESRYDFLRIKAVNLVIGVAVGAVLLALGL
jgi:hypothetical protein